MTEQELFQAVSQGQGIPVESLKQKIEPVPQGSGTLWYASSLCEPKQCFSNALQMAASTGCEYVLGYVYLHEFGLAIEHAWNRDEGGDLDVTAELFWKEALGGSSYVELLSMPFEQALDAVEKYGHVDHSALRMSKEYGSLFRRERAA